MTNEQAEIQQAAREPEPELIAKAKMFLAQPQHQIGIKKARGHHPYVIDVTKCEYCRTVVAMAAFHISQSEEERKRIQELEQEHEDLRNDLSSAIDRDETLEAEVLRLRGALQEEIGYKTDGPCQLGVLAYCRCKDCIRKRSVAALQPVAAPKEKG